MAFLAGSVSLDPRLAADYLKLAEHSGGVRAVERTVLRSRSRVARDLLAYAAAPGERTSDELIGAIRAAREARKPGPPLDVQWAVSLARVIGMQGLSPTDADDATLLLTELRRQHGSKIFTPAVQETVVERLWQAGAHRLLRTWLPNLRGLRPETRRYLMIDLLNPFSMTPGTLKRRVAHGLWQRRVEAIFAHHGLEPVVVAEDASSPFDALECHTHEEIDDGPLVSVIMPVFRPGPELLTSVRSVCNQTWRNLEILIMDDASPPGHEQVLAACAALDERVQVHRMDQNGGTYLARNAAMDIATGALVTVQDADDWSHPRRIELQARALLADPETPATRSFCLRVSEDLVFQRPGYEVSQENASSLMFRREQTLATVGYFDRARKSADTEFRRRLELATGALVTDLRAPLAIVRMAPGSLSRADFTPGWHHVSRYVYRGAYERWHAQLAGGADPYLARFQEMRPFAVPQRFQVEQEALAERPPHYDVVVLNDWRFLGPDQDSIVERLNALTGAGYRVGLAHRESFLNLTHRRKPLHPQVLDLINEGTVDFVALDQTSSVGLLLVLAPEVLQLAPAEPSTLDVRQVVVAAERAPHALDGTDRRYTPAMCDATVRATFAVDPVWAPGSPGIRAMLANEIPSDRIGSTAWTLFTDGACAPSPRPGTRDVRPILGQFVENGTPAWPSNRDEILAIYPDDGTMDVRVLGQETAVVAALGSRPGTWTVWPAGELTCDEFLDQLDFYVHFPPATEVPAFDPLIARAIARGCVTVLPPRFEAVYGDAALYREPEAVAPLLRSLHADAQAYRQHSQRGLTALQQHFGTEAYLRKIAELIGSPRPRTDRADRATRLGTTAAAMHEVPRRELVAGRERQRRRDLHLILMVSAAVAQRLSDTLQAVRADPSLFGTQISVVHDASSQTWIVDAALRHPSVRFVRAAGGSRTDLVAAATAEVAGAEAPYLSIAALPKVREIRTWSRSLLAEAERLRTAGLDAGVPLLLWTRHGSPEAVAAYLVHALSTGRVQAGPVADYLGGLTLRAARARVEAVDPRGGQIEVFVWLAAKLLLDMPPPPWRYRLVLTRGREPVAVSPAVAPTLRVDNRGHRVWESVRAMLPLQEVAGGNYVFTIEVDTDVEALRVRRRLRPAKGVLLDARAVTMASDRDGKSAVRYLVHATGSANATHITVQQGSGPVARLQWAATMLRKDLGSLVRRRAGRRMVLLRLLRLLTRPFYAGRRIWLIGERTDTAQDNGLHLFRHLRRTHPGRHVYYVIDPKSPQRERVADLGNVVDHSSWRHQLLMLHADVLANAYSIRYLTPLPWGQANYVQHLAWRTGALRIYLKHGVHLNANAVKRGLSGYDIFLTVMARESEALRAVSGYDRQIREIGMPRYDGLTPAPPSRTVLFMPTWRQYLVPRLSGRANPGQVPFEGSAYEQFITGLLQSPRLHDMLEQHDYRLTFLPHYNVATHFDRVVAGSERIALADTNATSFQDLLRTCDAFITDYSSVHFDVAYLGTPVIYARFDEADYEAGHASRSWFDYERDGYGPVARTVTETLDALEEVLERGCTVLEVYAARVAEAFTYRDRKNSARVVAAIDDLAKSRRRAIEQS